MCKLVLIGGSNIDYIATSKDKLIPRVSNVGTLSVSFGGVMRNVAENLSRLGNNFLFITAIGNDELGDKMKKELKNLGITFLLPKTSFPSSSYLAINDSNHDMELGICDNRIAEDLSASFLESNKNILKESEYIILDSNLTQEALDYIFSNYQDKKIICESISPTKVLKFEKYLKYIYLIKCNIYEAQALTKTKSIKEKLISELLEKGVRNVVVSNQGNDIYYGNNYQLIDFVHIDKIDNFKNTTGCGDALFSGIIDHFIINNNLREAIIFGSKLSFLTLMSEAGTSKEVSKYWYKH